MAIQTFTSGQILTAAQMNTLQQQAVMTFTNEAARDAALTAPSEGMVAYLTAPTVPAATGATTLVPSGIQTIYNGTSWVCVTEVAGFTVTAGTTTSSGAFTPTLTSGGINPSVTVTTGTTALITVAANCSNSTAVSSYMSIAISGATTLSADTFETTWGAARNALGTLQTASRTYAISGLTAGTNTFTLNYLVAGGTGTWAARSITARGIA